LDFNLALLAPVLILILPITDTLFLILARVKNGRSIFRKSNDHMVLRLLRLGLPKQTVVCVMFAAGVIFSALGVVVVRQPGAVSALLLAAALVPYTLFLSAILKRDLDE
jgi:UDP-GlcNAc:undecaprenyl-phosphate/decaprenyl-phosphate GlcNAc-1-phosphate transferase